MRTDRLLQLAEFMESLPEEAAKRFDMCEWGLRPKAGPEETQCLDMVDCRTAGCLLGWSTACFREEPLVLEFDAMYASGQVIYTDEAGNRHIDFAAGQAFFDLTIAQSYWLFNPGNYEGSYYSGLLPEITPKDAARRIRDLVRDPSLAEGLLDA